MVERCERCDDKIIGGNYRYFPTIFQWQFSHAQTKAGMEHRAMTAMLPSFTERSTDPFGGNALDKEKNKKYVFFS